MKWYLPAGKHTRVVMSLIELLIAMAIVGILTGIVVPSIAGDSDTVAVAVVSETALTVQR